MLQLKNLQGIVQGNVTIKQWNDNTETFKILYSTTHFVLMNIPKNIQNMEVVGMYSDTTDKEQSFLIIEME